MVLLTSLVLAIVANVAVGLPRPETIISKRGNELRYDYLRDGKGVPHLVDTWLKTGDVDRLVRYNADRFNAYHLFTRSNPRVSQPLVINDPNRLWSSNFNRARRVIVLMHGFLGSTTTDFNTVLVPAFLQAEDCNVIVLDWVAGSHWGMNAIPAAEAAARFINWLNSVSGISPANYHIVGYSVGGHGAGIMARNVNGNVGYVTGLDPAERWDNTLFRPTDGVYTEVIHTSTMGMSTPLAHVDFFPNGGSNMPGCLSSYCDHNRSFYYLAESVRTGNFIGRRCNTVQEAKAGNCNGSDRLAMGGMRPKTGSRGIFFLRTNSRAPFAQG